jgi:multidrug efflux pump subunit AcrA (membrane-fusion protein)
VVKLSSTIFVVLSITAAACITGCSQPSRVKSAAAAALPVVSAEIVIAEPSPPPVPPQSAVLQPAVSFRAIAKFRARVKSVSKKPGELVHAGDLLMKLDVDAVRQEFETAFGKRTHDEKVQQLQDVRSIDAPSNRAAAAPNEAGAIVEAQKEVDRALREVGEATTALASAETALRDADAVSKSATAKVVKLQDLYNQGFIAEHDLDTARASAAAAAAGSEAAKSAMIGARQSLDRADLRLKSARTTLNSLEARETVPGSKPRIQPRPLRHPIQGAQATELSAHNSPGVQHLDEITDRVNHLDIRSESDGVVIGQMVQAGSEVQAGDTLMTVGSTKSLTFTALLPAGAQAEIKPGTSIQIFAGTDAKQPSYGVVTDLSEVPAGKVMHVTVSNSSGFLKPGAAAYFSLPFGNSSPKPVFIVPQRCVYSSGGVDYVFRIESGRLHRVSVSVLQRLADTARIQAELNAGDHIAADIPAGLSEGSAVRVR